MSFVGHDLHDVCTECKKEAKRVTANAEKAVLVSEKEQRLNPTSKYPLSKLSPKSQAERISRLKKEHAGFQQKLSKIVETTSKKDLCELNNERSCFVHT